MISHDLELVRRIADRILVMLHGRIIEEIQVANLGKITHHPYTQQLLNAALLGEGDEVHHSQTKRDTTISMSEVSNDA